MARCEDAPCCGCNNSVCGTPPGMARDYDEPDYDPYEDLGYEDWEDDDGEDN